jgi:hypothetical protein
VDWNTSITNQSVFYLFIAFTILLILSYSWGRRRNASLYKNAFQGLMDTFKPKEQTFTNIGGLTGFHANLLPKNNKDIERVDATITLLPRQAWLYYPFSRLVRGFDRLFITLHLKEGSLQKMQEAHLIEKTYSRFKRPKILNQDQLKSEEVEWGGLQFFLYYGSNKARQEVSKLLSKKGLPGQIRHVAIVPEQNRAFVFMIPRPGSVFQTMPKLVSWLERVIRS